MNVAIIIPCRNEEANIVECIEAIYASKLNRSIVLNVFVVDGRSDDGSIELLIQLQKKYSSLTIIENTKQLTPYAFNLGILKGIECDYFQIIGARQIICQDYLQKAILKLESEPQIWGIGGRVENVYLNDIGRIIASAMETTFGMGLGNFRTMESSGFVDTVGTPMYPKFVFEKIGYFDEELIRNQDDDFNYRISKAGGKIYFEAGISLKYYVRGNFKNLWKQFFQYGYWKVYVNKKHKSVTTIRQLIPPLFVLYLFLLIIAPFVSIVFFGVAAIPLIFYVIFTGYFSCKIVSKDKQISIFKIIPTFPVMHLSYGLGYLRGVVEFLLMNKKPGDRQKELSR